MSKGIRMKEGGAFFLQCPPNSLTVLFPVVMSAQLVCKLKGRSGSIVVSSQDPGEKDIFLPLCVL